MLGSRRVTLVSALVALVALGCSGDEGGTTPMTFPATGGATLPPVAGAAGTAGQPPASAGAPAAGGAGASGAVSTDAGNQAPPAAVDGGTMPPTAGAPSTDSGAPSADTSAPDPSPGCSGGSVQAGHTNETIEAGGRQREYVQHVPSTYDGSKPFSVLIDFHGGTYDGPRWDARASNKFKEMAETEHFIYLAPTGLNAWWTTTEGADGADGQFMRALIDRLKQTACVDNRRIYATGCSMGGDMSFFMACYFSDVIAAALPMCGSASFDLETECQPTRPLSLRFIIGSQDTLNCWEPPRTSVGNPCATEVQAVFKELNGCTGEPEPTHDGVCQTLSQCNEGTEVSICRVQAQHTTIYQAPDMDVYEEGWQFLKSYYLH